MAMTKRWTAEEVGQLPDDGFRYALIEGVLYRRPPTKPRHGRVTSLVKRHLGNFIEQHELGALFAQSGFILACDPDVLLGPDLAFVRSDHIPADEDEYPLLAPDLVVEVISPSQTGPSIDEKTNRYFAAGVRLVWALDPVRRTVHVRRLDGTDRLLSGHDDLDGEDVLPGFRLLVARLFA